MALGVPQAFFHPSPFQSSRSLPWEGSPARGLRRPGLRPRGAAPGNRMDPWPREGGPAQKGGAGAGTWAKPLDSESKPPPTPTPFIQKSQHLQPGFSWRQRLCCVPWDFGPQGRAAGSRGGGPPLCSLFPLASPFPCGRGPEHGRKVGGTETQPPDSRQIPQTLTSRLLPQFTHLCNGAGRPCSLRERKTVKGIPD